MHSPLAAALKASSQRRKRVSLLGKSKCLAVGRLSMHSDYPASNRNWGSCVVLPEPVSPTRTRVSYFYELITLPLVHISGGMEI